MIKSNHIYLLTSSLFFIGACVCATTNGKEAELLLMIALSFSFLFFLMSIPFIKIKNYIDQSYTTQTGQYCSTCEAQLTEKDIVSNICHSCGKRIKLN